MTSRKPAGDTVAGTRTETMRKGRQADSARRRQRVLTALDRATASGTEISASGIARAAGVDRTFLYRHRDLLEKIHAAEAAPPPAGGTAGPAVSRASLQADLLAAHERSIRLSARIRQLDWRMSSFRASGRIKVGDLVSAQITGTNGNLTAIAIQDPASIP